jgi:hypothetical protein
MTSKLDRYKLTFQLTAHGGLLEVRARTLAGQSRVETPIPSQDLLDQLLQYNPAHLPSAVVSQVGQVLHRCLTAGEIDELATDLFHDAREARCPVHFELRFDPDQAKLAQYPWEMITDRHNRLLVRDGLVDLTRYITYPQPPPVLDTALSRRPLLQVVARPVTLQPLMPVKLALKGIQRLAPASFEHLQNMLLVERAALWGLHFDGHGALVLLCRRCDAVSPLDATVCHTCGAPLSEAKQVGVLAFERDGNAEWVSTEELGSVLYNAQVGLALLLACETARVGDHVIFSGLAPGLILAGVPAVVGMQFPVADEFSRDFANAFYGRLLNSRDILDAMRTARSMTAKASWYSPVLYLRCLPTSLAERHPGPVFGTRSIDTAAPEEAQEGVDFLARLWIRRPETSPLSQEQLRKELGLLTPVPISTREAPADIKFEPVKGRKLRRGEVEVECKSPTCGVYPECIKLFVDELLDAPPAIFTCRGLRAGRTSLHFTVRQDGGTIATTSHPLQVIESHQQPSTGIGTKSHAIPVEDTIPTADVPLPTGQFSLVVRSGTGGSREVPLVRSSISIGRSSACDVVVQDPRVSRRHAKLRLRDQGWFIADQGSSHGTFVNGVRITAPHEVLPSDEVRLGNSTLQLLEHGPITVPPITTAQLADVDIGRPAAPVAAESPQDVPRQEAPHRPSRSQAAQLAENDIWDYASAPPAPKPAESPPSAPRKRKSVLSRAVLATMLSLLLAVAGLGGIVLTGGRLAAVRVAIVKGPTPVLMSPIAQATATAPASTPTAIPTMAISTPAPAQPPSATQTPAMLLAAGLLWVVILCLLVIVILLALRRRGR